MFLFVSFLISGCYFYSFPPCNLSISADYCDTDIHMHIHRSGNLEYHSIASSFFVFQVGLMIGRSAANGYDPAKRLENSLTTTSSIKTIRRVSMLSSDLQKLHGFHLHCVEIS